MTDHIQEFWTFISTTLTFAALASSIQVEQENTENHDWHWIDKKPFGTSGVSFSVNC